MYADDLGRMLGWEFSLMVATLRIINSGLLDELPTLKIQFSHYSGGIGRYLGRIRGFQQRDKWGTAACRGTAGSRSCRSITISNIASTTTAPAGPAPIMRPNGARSGCASARRRSRCRRRVFATDYPQAVRDPDEVASYVAAVRALGPNARAMVDGLAAEALIPDLRQRIAKRTVSAAQQHQKGRGTWHGSASSGSAIWACRWRENLSRPGTR